MAGTGFTALQYPGGDAPAGQVLVPAEEVGVALVLEGVSVVEGAWVDAILVALE